MALTKDHYIQLKDGVFDGTSKDDLDHLFQSLAADPSSDHIVLNFHGGLVSAAEAMQTAEWLTQHLNIYQIFFIWETSAADVIQQEGGLFNFIQAQLVRIGKEKFFLQLLMHVLQFAKGKIASLHSEGVSALSSGQNLPTEAAVWRELLSLKDNVEPFADVHPELPADAKLQDEEKQHFRDALASNQILQDEVQKIINGYRLTQQAQNPSLLAATHATKGKDAVATASTLISPSILQQMDQQESKVTERAVIGPSSASNFVIGKAIEVLSHVITRFAQKTDHGLYPTVVEEILRTFYLASVGKDVWDHIKQEPVDGFSQLDRGGAVFLQKLRDHYQNGHHPQITLVGHSAGSIYICQLLQEADKVLPPDVKFNVVLLAPACTYKHFADTLQACKARIASIRIFALRDNWEQAEVIASGTYTRSILYLISGAFEEIADTPILGMERFFCTAAPFNKWPEIAHTLDYLLGSPRNNVWSHANDGDGLNSLAEKHGDFYGDPATMTSLEYILRNRML